MLDTLPRNIGYLESDFSAGDDIAQFIFAEIRKRKPAWKADTLYHVDLVADKPLNLSIDGWNWHTRLLISLSGLQSTAALWCWTIQRRGRLLHLRLTMRNSVGSVAFWHYSWRLPIWMRRFLNCEF